MNDRGNSFANGQIMSNGNSMNNGPSLPRLVKSQQDAGFALRPATCWDFMESGMIW